jgi:hypothetical protein
LSFLLEPLSERPLRHKRHHEIKNPLVLARIEHRKDVLMVQALVESYLAEKTIRSDRFREFRLENLDGDDSAVSLVASAIDRSRRPATEL